MSMISAPDEQDIQIPVAELLDVVLERGASDLHLTVGAPPTIRLHGDLERLSEYPVMTPRALQGMIYAILPQKMRERLEQELELDMSYALPGRARFRVNVYFQRDSLGAAFRLIPYEIRKIEELGLPGVVGDLARFPRGFVVVTGPTGSGKSTTLAGMVAIVNRERAAHIMTVEDPIEFLHRHDRCIVNQREVGADTHSFSQALKHVLRQDPDVILVGEMRDLETIATAITAAETGHLVFATLHTQDAPQTIDRIIDVFPPHQQQQVYSIMQAGGRFGMQTMDQSLANLVRSGLITQQLAYERCHDAEELNRLIGGAGASYGAPGAGAAGSLDGGWTNGGF
jgi:twitching motility protein PilT